MMPPKKSKAARSVNQDNPDTSKGETNGKPAEETGQNVNIFDVEIVKGKRQRKVLPSEQTLTDWIESHLEERSGHALVLSDAYKHYVDSCVSANSVAWSQSEFCKVVKEKFPHGTAVKESSPFACLIRVKKEKGQRTKTGTLKMKDVIAKTIEELGNPHKGVRFFMLKQSIAKKYPALGIDKRPRFLLGVLERCIQYRQLQLVRGVGMCGLYRLFGPSKSDDEDKENHKVEQSEEGSEDKEEDTEDDDTKRKKDESEPEEKQKSKQNNAGVQKKSKKTKRANRVRHNSVIVHSAPQRVEDAFMLAMTFMVEPKEASVKKILKYVTEYYEKDLSIERLRKSLEKGCEKGYWQQVTGQGFSGTFRLLLNNCDPSADDDLVGQVTNALIACTEPKYCSATLLKSYLIEYHPEFDIQNKPYLFKKALERGIKKNIIRQLRGIGASGSFQLNKAFTPTPTILRGEDSEMDYDVSDDEVVVDFGQFDIASFQNAYQPRPTKSRGHGRQASKGISNEPLPVKSSSTLPLRKKKEVYYGEEDLSKERVKKTKKRGTKSSASGSPKRRIEDEESEPAKKKQKSGKKSAARKRSQSRSNTAAKTVVQDEESPMKKTHSKSAKRASVKKDAGMCDATPRRSPVKSCKGSSSDENEEVPPKKAWRLKKAGRQNTRSKEREQTVIQHGSSQRIQRSPRKSYAEDSYTSDEEDSSIL